MTEEAKHTPTLLPCPFCGSENVAQGASRDRISVWCFCGARGPEAEFPENCDPLPPIRECHAAWNRRSDAELTTLRTKLAEAVKALRDTPCPRPCNGRPDDSTAGQCFDALECGCSTGTALSQAQDPSPCQ